MDYVLKSFSYFLFKSFRLLPEHTSVPPGKLIGDVLAHSFIAVSI